MILTLLVADHHRNSQQICIGGGGLGETDVRTADHKVGDIQRADVVADDFTSVQVVHGNAEEALYLRTVQIHGEHSIRTCRLDRIRTDSRSD